MFVGQNEFNNLYPHFGGGGVFAKTLDFGALKSIFGETSLFLFAYMAERVPTKILSPLVNNFLAYLV